MKTTEEYAFQFTLELFKNCQTFKEKEAAIEEAWNLAKKFTEFGGIFQQHFEVWSEVGNLPHGILP